MKTNVIGKQFWAWTVLNTINKNQRNYLEVQCVCGTTRIVRASTIYTGKSRSCGSRECVQIKIATQQEVFDNPNLMPINIGDVFRKLTVIDYALDPVKNKKQYVVKCTCGNVLTVSQYDLRSGRKGSCGTSHYALRIGQQFGDLTVSDIDINDPTKITTVCSCGEVEQYKRKQLLPGNIKTCFKNRQNKNKHPINAGNVFGKLTVLKQVYLSGKSKYRFYKCKCECGNLCVKRFDGLLNTIAPHCGCSILTNNPEHREKLAAKREQLLQQIEEKIIKEEKQVAKDYTPAIKSHITKSINSVFELLVHISTKQ